MTFALDGEQGAYVPEDGGAGLRAILVRTITFADTPGDGTILDLMDFPAGTFIYDVFQNLRTAWPATNSNAFLVFGVNLAGSAVYLGRTNPNGPGLALDATQTNWNDNAYLSGNADATETSLFMAAAFVTSGSPHLPTVTLRDVTLQAIYRQSGPVPDAGEVDIWVVAQLPE